MPLIVGEDVPLDVGGHSPLRGTAPVGRLPEIKVTGGDLRLTARGLDEGLEGDQRLGVGEPQGCRTIRVLSALTVDACEEVVEQRTGVAVGDVAADESGAFLDVVLGVQEHGEPIGLLGREVLREVHAQGRGHDVEVVELNGSVDLIVDLLPRGDFKVPFPSGKTIDEVLGVDPGENATSVLLGFRLVPDGVDIALHLVAAEVFLVCLVVGIVLVLVEVQGGGVGSYRLRDVACCLGSCLEQPGAEVPAGFGGPRLAGGHQIDRRTRSTVEELGHAVGQSFAHLLVLACPERSEVAVATLEIAAGELCPASHLCPGGLVPQGFVGLMHRLGLLVEVLASRLDGPQLVGLLPHLHGERVVLETGQATRAVSGDNLGVDGMETLRRSRVVAPLSCIGSLRRHGIVHVDGLGWHGGESQYRSQ